ncbi:MAG TPA: Ig-like domain-containing protein [Bryobacteraceae bacterium]|nr:Ig-like domain-containing protein [Bryobacteraceae bacterium]
MTPTFVAPYGALAAPRRNRFFYGKMMDVAQFEQEQAYFRTQQALINRLAIGAGVLAGLNLSAGSGGPGSVRVAPGAALDGFGRLIVIPSAFEFDAHQPTGPSGAPSGAPLTTGVVLISLAYAEAAADPVPVMTPHCDAPGDCAPSTVVEGYVLLVQPQAASPAPPYGCQLGKVAPPPDPALFKLLSGKVSASFPPVPADASVPLGTVNLADGTVDAFAARTIVFSLPLLWQVMVCLGQQMGAIQGTILRYVSGDNQTAAPEKALAGPLVVQLVDGGGNPVPGALVQFQTSGGSVAPASIATDKAGRAQTVWTLGPAVGAQTLTAGAVGSPLSVTFTAKA